MRRGESTCLQTLSLCAHTVQAYPVFFFVFHSVYFLLQVLRTPCKYLHSTCDVSLYVRSLLFLLFCL